MRARVTNWWLLGAAFYLAACQRTGVTREQGALGEPSKAGASGTPECFSVTAESTSASARSIFAAKRCQGGGVTWAGILNVLVQRRGETRAVEQPTSGWTGDVRILSWKGGTARFAIDDEGSAALFCSDATDLLNDIRSEAKRLNESSAELARAMAETDPESLECFPEGLAPGELLKRASPPPPISPAEAGARAESLARLRALLSEQHTWCWTPGAARFTPWKGAFSLDVDGRVTEPGKTGPSSVGSWSYEEDGRIQVLLPGSIHHFETTGNGRLGFNHTEGREELRPCLGGSP
jgi:hypothetical protein